MCEWAPRSVSTPPYCCDVDLSRGYDLCPSVQSQLRLLNWIADNGGSAHGALVLDLGGRGAARRP